jgi:hypothetical protein
MKPWIVLESDGCSAREKRIRVSRNFVGPQTALSTSVYPALGLGLG